jgi:hypothetical protein
MAIQEDKLARIEKQLELIAHLLLLAIRPDQRPSINEQVALLREHGLTPAEIGRIIGRKANYVSAVKTIKKKAS